jgi:myosin heavy subunit
MTEVAPVPTWGPDGLGPLLSDEGGVLKGSSVFVGSGGVEDPRRADPNLEIQQFSEILAGWVQAVEEKPTQEEINQTLLSEVNRWNKRIQRYQEENRELVAKNESLAQDVEKARVDQLDIIFDLREEEKQKKQQLADIQTELKKTTEEKDARIEELTRELADYNESSTAKIEALTEQIANVERQLDSLKHFEQEKAKMDAELKQLNETIMRDQIEHREKIRTLEREWEIERDRSEKEKKRAIARAKQDMLKIQDQHISEVTRKAIEDNAQLELEIAYQSRQVKLLYEENSEYNRSTVQLRRELEVQQDAERVLAQKNCSYQKTIKALLAKMKKLEGENGSYKADIETFTAAGGAPNKFVATSSTEGGFGDEDTATASLVEVQAKLGALKKDCKANRAEVKRLKAKLGAFEEVMEEASRYIMSTGGSNAGSRPTTTGSGSSFRQGGRGQLPPMRGMAPDSAGSDYAVQLYIKIKSQLGS